MSNIRELIREKFGYTKDVGSELDLHKDVTDGKKLSIANHPLEPFRKSIKAILGVQQIDDPVKVEEAINLVKLEQLAKKHGFSDEFIQAVARIKDEVGKSSPDREQINKDWEQIKKLVPYWALGLVSPKIDEQEKDEKESLVNLIQLMNDFNKQSEEAGKERAKNTPHASNDTAAKKNIDKIKKEHGIKSSKENKTDEIENKHGNGALKELEDQIKDGEAREENKLGEKAEEINKDSEKEAEKKKVK